MNSILSTDVYNVLRNLAAEPAGLSPLIAPETHFPPLDFPPSQSFAKFICHVWTYSTGLCSPCSEVVT